MIGRRGGGWVCALLAAALPALAGEKEAPRPRVDAPGQLAATGSLRGTVTYLQRIALPGDAEAEVSLVEIGADAESRELVTQVIRPAGQPPIAFDLRFSTDAVHGDGAYGLTARISYEGRPRFATPAPVRVLTQGHPRDQIRLVLPMLATGAPPGPRPPTPAPGPTAGQRAAEIDRLLARYRTVDGVWREGQAHSRYRAHFLAGDLLRLDENMTLNEVGSSEQNYYFEHGALIHYRSTGTRRSGGPNGTTSQRVTLVFSVASEGVVNARKEVDGRNVKVPAADLARAQSHARVLSRLADPAQQAPPDQRATAVRIERGPTGFGPVLVTLAGPPRRLAVQASGAWLAEGGRAVLYALRGGAGGFENEGQSLYRYDVGSAQSRRVFAERYLIREVREVTTRSGARALAVRMADGGLGAPHAALAHPDRGLVWRASFARLGAATGGLIRVEHLPHVETDDWSRVKPLRVESLDLDKVLAGPASQTPRD